MRKYYVSHVDFSEIAAVSADKGVIKDALKQLKETGALNANGKADANYLNTLSGNFSFPFLQKLHGRLSRYKGGINGTYDTLKKLLSAKEYTAMYLYIAIMYGYIEWRVPEILSLLPASPDALKVFMIEFMADFEEFLKDIEEEGKKPKDAPEDVPDSED